MCTCVLSRIQLCNPMDCRQPGPSVHGILHSRILDWVAMSSPPPGDLPNPEIEPTSLTSPSLAGGFFTFSATWEALSNCRTLYHTYLVTTIPLNNVPIIFLDLSRDFPGSVLAKTSRSQCGGT